MKMVAAGRELTFTGPVEKYLGWYSGFDADHAAVAHATKDLPRGSLCIDAGANVGLIAIPLAVQRPDCHVIAIEPVPANANALRANLEANRVKNVEVIEAALGAEPGVVSMTNNGPWSSVWEKSADTVDCKCITLDDFDDRKTAFLKIDVEGYEPQVIAGAKSLLAKSKPLIHIEFNSWYLMVHHHDPISFAKAIWQSCEVLGSYYQEKFLPAPPYDVMIVHDNITAHGSVTDLLIKPIRDFPSLEEMIYAPAALAMYRQLNPETARPAAASRATANVAS